VRALGELFAQRFEVPASLLQGGEATRSAFLRLAPTASHLHIATHGYFAIEHYHDFAQTSPEDDWGERGALITRLSLAPGSLCGIALAGANALTPPGGEVPGILTAEEISGLDLSSCEIAVLSACETNAGLMVSSDLHSLQSALHAAGVRTSVASLWKVHDTWTRDLMTDFYRRIWIDRSPSVEALWEAKRALRQRGAELRDWAAWVLTGDAR
jgi:CHAT domain-containing protein